MANNRDGWATLFPSIVTLSRDVQHSFELLSAWPPTSYWQDLSFAAPYTRAGFGLAACVAGSRLTGFRVVASQVVIRVIYKTGRKNSGRWLPLDGSFYLRQDFGFFRFLGDQICTVKFLLMQTFGLIFLKCKSKDVDCWSNNCKFLNPVTCVSAIWRKTKKSGRFQLMETKQNL